MKHRHHALDRIYGRWSQKQTVFFGDGWGNIEPWEGGQYIDRLTAGEPPIEIHWTKERKRRGVWIREGWFESPAARDLPPESRKAPILMVIPPGSPMPMAIHMASTGDEGFKRRLRALVWPLAQRGIGGVILENPYYGRRRPKGQDGVSLATVADLYAMGFASILEGKALACWLDGQGLGPVGVTGVSMGGQMALTIAAVTQRPLAVSPCIAAHSAVPVFTEGVLSGCCDWVRLGHGVGGPQNARTKLRNMLSATDVRRAPDVVRPDAVVVVAARRDAYLPQRCGQIVHDHCPGSALWWIETGHVGGFVFGRERFYEAVVESFGRLG